MNVRVHTTRPTITTPTRKALFELSIKENICDTINKLHPACWQGISFMFRFSCIGLRFMIINCVSLGCIFRLLWILFFSFAFDPHQMRSNSFEMNTSLNMEYSKNVLSYPIVEKRILLKLHLFRLGLQWKIASLQSFSILYFIFFHHLQFH